MKRTITRLHIHLLVTEFCPNHKNLKDDNFERNQVSRVPKARIEMMTFFRSSGHWGRDIVTKPILLTKWFGIIR